MEERVQSLPEQPKDQANPPPPEPSGPQYEFTKEQNGLMEELEWKLGVTGTFVLIAGIAMGWLLISELVKGTFPWGPWWAAGAGVVVLLMLAHGGWLIGASSGFEKIHKTQGRDIDYLMDALKNLDRFFTLMAVTAGIVLIGAFVRGVLSFFF